MLIKLSAKAGYSFYINPEHITLVEPCDNIHWRIKIQAVTNQIYILESPEQIVELWRKAQYPAEKERKPC